MKRTLVILCGVVLTFALTGTASATLIELSLTGKAFEHYDPGDTYPEHLTVGSLDFRNELAGLSIKSVKISGQWGHPVFPFLGTTAHHLLFLDGFQIAATSDDPGDPNNPFYTPHVSWSYEFHPGEFSVLQDGIVELFAYQTSEGSVALRDITLSINAVPEPCAMLLVGSGLLALAGFKRRMQRKSFG